MVKLKTMYMKNVMIFSRCIIRETKNFLFSFFTLYLSACLFSVFYSAFPVLQYRPVLLPVQNSDSHDKFRHAFTDVPG